MARSKTTRRQKRALDQLLESGLIGTALGLAMVAAPAFVGASTQLKPMALALRLPGLMAMGLGLLLLVAHFVLKRRHDKAKPVQFTSSFKPKRPRRWQDGLAEVGDTAQSLTRRIEPTAGKPNRSDPTPASFKPSTASPTVARPEPATSWSPAVFAAIEWRRFEAVCEALFSQAGFETNSQSHGADGGVDIWLYSANAHGPVAVVQCKHWQGKAVGVKEMREFFGVMASHQLKRGTYATTSSYTADARQFAKANGINAMDGLALLALIAKRTPEQKQTLLDVAYEGDYWRPTCASCGIKLVARKPAKGGTGFWGCSNYPRCKSKLPMVAALRLDASDLKTE